MAESERLRVLLVDDEPGGLASLRTALEPMSEVEVVGECSTVHAAATSTRELSPDLVFLDVKLGTQSGLTLRDHLEPDELPPIVFVTAYAEHAVDAFDMNAVDYVLKPFQDARIARSVRRALRRGALRAALQADTAPRTAAPLGPARESAERIMVRQEESIRFVRVERVVRLEAAGNYVKVVSDEGDFSIRSPLRDLLGRLDRSTFVRVHRSHAVNLDRVVEIQPWFGGDYVVVLDNDEEVRLSRSYRDEVLRAVR